MKLQDSIGKIYWSIVSVFLSLLFGLFTIDDNIRYVLLSASILLLLFIVIRSDTLHETGKEDIKTPVLLFLICFVTRYLYCNFMDGNIDQIYDFKNLLNATESGIFTDDLRYFRMFLHKFFYPFFLHISHITTQSRILFFQSICASCITVLLFYIGKEIDGKRLGAIQAVLYIMWPAQLVYTQVVAEDHMAAFWTVLIVFLLIRLIKRLEKIDTTQKYRHDAVKLFLMAILTGGACGICAFFKDWALVILVGVMICGLYLFIGYDVQRRICLIVCILCILIGRIGIEHGAILFAESRLGVKANNGNAVYLYVTLDPDASGGYDLERYLEYFSIVEENDHDFKKADKIAMDILKEKKKNGYKKMPSLLLKKGRAAYVSDDHMFDIVFGSEAKESFQATFPWVRPVIGYVGMIYYIGIVLLLLLALLTPDRYNFFVLLCILGGMLVGLLIEGQGRYKYSIEPIWCIPAAYAFLHWRENILYRMTCGYIRRLWWRS